MRPVFLNGKSSQSRKEQAEQTGLKRLSRKDRRKTRGGTREQGEETRGKGEGKKGGNDVGSLIMKELQERN